MKQQLTKQQAIQAMEEGKIVTHRFFSENEFIKLSDNGYDYETEEGYNVSPHLFWTDRPDPSWLTDWSIWQAPTTPTNESEREQGEQFTPGNWELDDSVVGVSLWASDERADGKCLATIFSTAATEQDMNLLVEAKNMYYALKEYSALLDGLINRTPTGKQREELCDMNINVKTILNRFNK
jgi:hypothetical protein